MRRRTPLKPSKGTVWQAEVRAHARRHYAGCYGPLAGMKGACDGALELDHVRASHGMGMKSESTVGNAARLCNWHHDLKGRDGKTWRPRLLSVIGSLMANCPECRGDCGHVDPRFDCASCQRRAVPA